MQTNDMRVVVIGDGPTGLSAALLLAKSQFHVDVLGSNQTPVHKAMLNNYLADDSVPGPDFIVDARKHATHYGATLHDAKVERVELGDTFRVHTSAGSFEGHYLILATGFDNTTTKDLGLKTDPEGIQVDRNGRTSRDRIYAGGALTRGTKTQVATSVGDGAAIALDIISRFKGQPAHDWDVLKAKPQT